MTKAVKQPGRAGGSASLCMLPGWAMWMALGGNVTFDAWRL